MEIDAIRSQFHEAAGSYGGWHGRCAERLVALTRIARGDRVLDVGSGTGSAARATLQRVGPTRAVVGIDIAEAMVDRARRDVPDADFVVGAAATLPFAQASFRVVVCSSAIFYLPIQRAMREWARVLVPGGVCVFSTMATDSPRLGVLVRQVAARHGVRLVNPNGIGRPGECARLLSSAAFGVPDVREEEIFGD